MTEHRATTQRAAAAAADGGGVHHYVNSTTASRLSAPNAVDQTQDLYELASPIDDEARLAQVAARSSVTPGASPAAVNEFDAEVMPDESPVHTMSSSPDGATRSSGRYQHGSPSYENIRHTDANSAATAATHYENVSAWRNDVTDAEMYDVTPPSDEETANSFDSPAAHYINVEKLLENKRLTVPASRDVSTDPDYHNIPKSHYNSAQNLQY